MLINNGVTLNPENRTILLNIYIRLKVVQMRFSFYIKLVRKSKMKIMSRFILKSVIYCN